MFTQRRTISGQWELGALRVYLCELGRCRDMTFLLRSPADVSETVHMSQSNLALVFRGSMLTMV